MRAGASLWRLAYAACGGCSAPAHAVEQLARLIEGGGRSHRRFARLRGNFGDTAVNCRRKLVPCPRIDPVSPCPRIDPRPQPTEEPA